MLRWRWSLATLLCVAFFIVCSVSLITLNKHVEEVSDHPPLGNRWAIICCLLSSTFRTLCP